MKFFIGKIFKTLLYQVDKEIKETLYKNEFFLKSQWSSLERNFILWSSHYIKYIFLVLLLAFLVVANLIYWQPLVQSFDINYLPKWKLLFEAQGVFLTGQLTIIGVVYPLVIGLIGLLLQNKSAKETIFSTYRKYSGFMFAGLSGLALSGFLVISYILRAYLDDSQYIAFCITSTVWLASNILLTSWFFVQTFKILEKVHRDKLVLRFSIHESCEFDIRTRIKKILSQSAVENNLLINPNEKILGVETEAGLFLSSDDNYSEVKRKVPRDRIIKDIRYRLINIAIRLQIVIFKIKKIEGCTIYFHTPIRGGANSKEMILARYKNFNINPIVKFLIKSAFSFQDKKKQASLGFAEILDGFIGSGSDALKDGNSKDFSDAIDHIAAWHTELALALSFTNDRGEEDNWLLLSSDSFFPVRYLDELLIAYYKLAQEAVEKIPHDVLFYRYMLRLHKRIFSGRDVLVQSETKSLIQGSYNLWFLLIEWSSFNSLSKNLNVTNKYENVLYDFVGSWENWLFQIEPSSKRSGDLERSYPAFIAHLEYTALMAISALKFNNYEAAGWGVDMLNNWLENFSSDDYCDVEYLWRSVLFNHYYLQKDPSGQDWKIILNGNSYNHLDAFSLAFRNACLDLRILTACYILLKPNKDNQLQLLGYVKALLFGTPIHKTGGMGPSQSSIQSAPDLLGAYIRHSDYGRYGNNTYGSWLSSILQLFGQFDRKKMVSGRSYSSYGECGLGELRKAYVEIAIFFSQEKWRFSSELEEAILSDAFTYHDREAMVCDLRRWQGIVHEERSYILFNEQDEKKLISNFNDSITEVINLVEHALSKDIGKAIVDRDRLIELGISSSNIFQNADKPSFPMRLFKNIKPTQSMSDDFLREFRIQDFYKEQVAIGFESCRETYLDEQISANVSEHVKATIMMEVFKYPPSDSYKYKNIDDMRLDIGRRIGSMERPVLFVGLKELAIQLRYEKNISCNNTSGSRTEFGDEYICHIGLCEVYRSRYININYCVLTTKDLFDTVILRELDDGRFVEVVFIPNKDTEKFGALKFDYWMDVSLAKDISFVKFELDSGTIESTGSDQGNAI